MNDRKKITTENETSCVSVCLYVVVSMSYKDVDSIITLVVKAVAATTFNIVCTLCVRLPRFI